jgi:outer membrane protein OmpA-like peptidoglycan-associated protein
MKALFTLLLVAACSRGPAIRAVEPVVPLPPSPVFAPEQNRGRVVVTSTDIEILDTITFVGNTAQLAPTSSKILDAVAATMHGNPSILLMEVRGHVGTDEHSDPRVRAELSIRRAEAVVAELITRGVAATRLDAYGASDSEPLSASHGSGRIEFLIVDRDRD